MTRDEIVAQARTYLGQPWRHRGRSPDGLDCAGLLVLLSEHFGHEVEDVEGYSRLPDKDRFTEHLKAQFMLTRPPFKPGQIVVLRDGVLPCHCGILAEKHGRLTLIHSTVARRKVVEEPFEPYWRSMFRAVLDFPDVED